MAKHFLTHQYKIGGKKMAALMFSDLVWETSTFLKTIILGHLQIAVHTTNTIKLFKGSYVHL